MGYKNIKGYNGEYKINEDGDILSFKKNKIQKIKPSINKDGYYYVTLYKKGKPKTCRVHKLVALNFIPNPENKPVVDHIDGNKLNNNSKNLRWATVKENHNNPNTYKDISGENNPMKKYIFSNEHKLKLSEHMLNNPINKSKIICLDNNKIYNTIASASRELNICASSIHKACKGITNTAGNKRFKYYKEG